MAGLKFKASLVHRKWAASGPNANPHALLALMASFGYLARVQNYFAFFFS